MRCHALTAAAILFALCPTVAAQGPRPEFYDQLATGFLERHGAADAEASTFNLGEFHAAHFVTAPIGLYEISIEAAALTDGDTADHYKDLVKALTQAQDHWLGWLEEGSPAAEAARKDLAPVAKWVSKWSASDLRSAAQSSGGNVLELMGASDDVQQAAARLREAMTRGTPLGLDREPRAEPLILAPNRKSFLELAAFAGWLYPNWQHVFWGEGMPDWTNFFVDDYKVLALEFAQPGRPAGDWIAGLDMNYKVPNGMSQQVVQLAANSMFSNYYGQLIPPSVAGSLAVNLVVEQFGECNTRVDGDLRERRTEAREIFVPGGNPSGGILPANSAESRWREGGGEEFFAEVLNTAQAAGGKGRKRSDQQANFELVSDNASQRTTVQAPFLGSAASHNAEPPSGFYGDRLEFLRAYRSCFMNWLRTEVDGKKSEETFAQFLMNMAKAENAEAIENVIVSTYEAPLSDPKMDKKSLEARFLAWLKKQ